MEMVDRTKGIRHGSVINQIRENLDFTTTTASAKMEKQQLAQSE
jgi:hypothetical protein